MLGSNPSRDSRMRRHHADRGRREKILPSPYFMLMLSPHASENPLEKWSVATSLSMLAKLRLFNLIRKSRSV